MGWVGYKVVSKYPIPTLRLDGLITTKEVKTIIGLYHDQVTIRTPPGGTLYSFFLKKINNKQMFRC